MTEEKVKKPYEKPKILTVQELHSRSGPCAKTASDASCQSAVFS